MRRRVLQATVAAVTVAVILLGVPLTFIGAQMVRQNEVRELQTRVTSLARTVDARLAGGGELTDADLDSYVGGGNTLRASVYVITPDGTRLHAGGTAAGASISERRNTEQGAVVVLFVSRWDVFWLSAQAVALVIVATLVAFGAGIAMALWQARRLAAPLVLLAASAEQLGSGQVRPRLEPSGVEEIDQVALELGRSSDRMGERLAAERQFAADASHQLRTPLTALSMRIEEISLASDQEDVREEARIALEQVERLGAVVEDLLARSRRSAGGTTEPVHLFEVVHQQQEEWEPTFAQVDRELVVDVDDDVQVLATPGALAQVLATLIENSLKHGAGDTVVRSRQGTNSSGVVLEVADSGAGVSDELAPRIFEREVTSGRGTGLGLALARDLVAADGGRLELAQRRPAVFAIFLAAVPRTLDAGVVLPSGSVFSTEGDRRWRRR